MTANQATAADNFLVLDGDWALVDETGQHRLPMRLPGDVHSALIECGLLEDPYFGANEVASRWPAERDWTASREFFIADATPLDRWHLEIAALDTVAEIAINGVQVHASRNAFRRYRPDVTAALRHGTNLIEIRFRSSVREAAEAQAAQPWFVPWHDGNCAIANGNMLRKPQCDFGWDWNIALAPFGLYESLRLERTPALRIDDVIVDQMHDFANAKVRLDVTVIVAACGAGPETLVISACGMGAAIEAMLVAGENRISASLTIDRPDLWWPAGHGPQALHELEIHISEARAFRRIGLRQIELRTDMEGEGRRFAIAVNGREIFCRGANWIPADALPGRIRQDAVRDLLASAITANMNMIRVWGGGRYEPDWFYDLCDEMGLLVWQDFMFACNHYPSTREFLAEVETEVHDVVRRISHHACLALWCGDNELIGALDWFPASRENRDRYLVAYDRLNRTIEDALLAECPDANWWPSSPSPGPMSFGDAWHDDSSGDMHVWTVWHEGRDFSHYHSFRPRFCSEFGFQSFPSMPVARGFAVGEDLNIASPVMEAHQKNAGGNARIAETMFGYFRFPKAFDDFVWLSQIQQGLALKTAVDWWRSLKPHCMGTLYWQLNDTWPVASWASLDHGGEWKAVHHLARRFFRPVNVVAIADQDAGLARLHAINDTPETVRVSVIVDAWSMDGQIRRIADHNADCPPDRALPLPPVDLAALDADEFLLLRFESSDGTSGLDHLMPKPYKTYVLPDAGIICASEIRGDRVRTTLRSERPAFFVTLECEVAGRFSDNAVTLVPGEPATIDFIPADGETDTAAATMKVRDLRSSYA